MIEYCNTPKFPAESWTLSVNRLDQPTDAGTPAMRPVALFSVIPGGRAPLVTLHMYGGFPPVADMVAAYAVPTAPFGRSALVIVSVLPLETALETVIVYDCEAVVPISII